MLIIFAILTHTKHMSSWNDSFSEPHSKEGAVSFKHRKRRRGEEEPLRDDTYGPDGGRCWDNIEGESLLPAFQ